MKAVGDNVRANNREGAFITSARDSRLTALLAPLIQGNCKTSLYAFVRDGEAQYRTSSSVLDLCNGLTNITCPCHRVSGGAQGYPCLEVQ